MNEELPGGRHKPSLDSPLLNAVTPPRSETPDRPAPTLTKAPPRPPFTSGLPKPKEVPMPSSVWLVMALVIASAVGFFWFTIRAALRQSEIRGVLEKELAERSPNYPAADVESAVLVTMIGLAVISVLLVLGELLSANKLRHQKLGGRRALLFLTVLHIPVFVVTPAFRDGGRPDEIGVLVQAGCLIAASIIARLPAITTWLKSRPSPQAALFAPSPR